MSEVYRSSPVTTKITSQSQVSLLQRAEKAVFKNDTYKYIHVWGTMNRPGIGVRTPSYTYINALTVVPHLDGGNWVPDI